MARTEREVLNHLIAICRDGARGFRLAADHVKTAELKRSFDEAAFQRDVFAGELMPYAERLGGETTPPGTSAGKLHRGWMMIQDAMAQYDEPLVLAQAIRGEREAANAYAGAVIGVLPSDVRGLVEQQYQAVIAMQHELDRFVAYHVHP
jgi:uncharacterized protein (TIGR02284 family)